MARRWLTRLWTRKVRPSDGPPRRRRIERYFECNWLSDRGEEETRVRSISPTGCFIDSRVAPPQQGACVREIRVALPGGCITVEGTVLEATPGVGFAVRFANVDHETRARLQHLVAPDTTTRSQRV